MPDNKTNNEDNQAENNQPQATQATIQTPQQTITPESSAQKPSTVSVSYVPRSPLLQLKGNAEHIKKSK